MLVDKTIQFQLDTLVDVTKVGKQHIGQVQLRPADGSDPNVPKGTMQHYFPKGATIAIHDYLGHPDVLDVTAAAGPLASFSLERPLEVSDAAPNAEG